MKVQSARSFESQDRVCLYWGLLLVFVVSLAIRLFRIPIEGLWGDEILQIHLAVAQPTGETFRNWLGSVLGNSLVQAQPPFSYVMVRFSNWLFGHNLWGFRVPSALAGALACTSLVWFGKRWGSLVLGIAAGLVLSVFPWHIWYSANARPYVWVSLFSIVIFGMFLENPNKESNRFSLKYLALFFIVSGCGLFSNLFFFFFTSGLMAVDLMHSFLVIEKRKIEFRWNPSYFQRFSAWAIPCFFFLIYLGKLMKVQDSNGYYEATSGIGAFALRALEAIEGCWKQLPNVFDFATRNHAVLASMGVVAFLVILRAKNRQTFTRGVLGVLLGALAISAGFAYGNISWWGYPYVVSVSMASFVLLLFSFSRIYSNSFATRVASSSLATLLLAMSIYHFIGNWSYMDREDWIRTTQDIHNLPKNAEVAFHPTWLDSNLRFTEGMLGLEPRPLVPEEVSEKWIFTILRLERDSEVFSGGEWSKEYEHQFVWGWKKLDQNDSDSPSKLFKKS